MPERTCRKCGQQFRVEAAEGLCPRCLFESGTRLARQGAHAQAVTGTFQELHAEPATSSEEPRPRRPAGGRRLGDYELLEEVGSGGMGVVYKARQLRLNRIVAVKMLLAAERAAPVALQRFSAEAQLAAGLHHPNIVTVYETGEAEGRLYFSMEYVEGRTLSELARGTPLAPERGARYVRQIAAAIHYAHQKGVLHRDLKPSNVLIDKTDSPRITDFGLAKHFTADSDLTLSGQVLGSPNFMSPEQASSRLGVAGPRTDLYGLGAILYFLLTGRPPFHAATVSDTLDQVLHTIPAPPRLLNPTVPVDLETICLKCLEKEPSRRYETAQAVADELDRFLRGEPVRARALGPLGRLWRWSRREPVLAVLGASLALLLLVVSVGAPIAIVRIERERQRSEAEATRKARYLYVADMNLAFQALRENRLGRVRELLERHRPGPGEEDLRSWEWGYLWHESESQDQFTLTGHSGAVNRVAFSPNGQYLASASDDRTARVWDMATRTEVASLPHWAAVTALIFTSDGKRLITGAYVPDTTLRSWAVGNWRLEATATNQGTVGSLSLSSDGRYLAVTDGDRLVLRDAASLRLLEVVAESPTCTPYALFAPEKPLLLAVEDGGLGQWDADQHKWVGLLPFDCVGLLALSPDGETLAIGGESVRVLRQHVNEPPRVLTNAMTAFLSGAFSADGAKLAAADLGGTITVWETADWRPWGRLKGHQQAVTSVAFSPDGRLLASASRDHLIKLWNADEPPASDPLSAPSVGVTLGSATAGETIVHYFADKRTIEISLGIPRRERIRKTLPVPYRFGPQVSPDGRFLALTEENGTFGIWDVTTTRRIHVLAEQNVSQSIPAFSPDSSLVMGVDGAKLTRIVWRVEDRQEIARRSFEDGPFGLWGAAWGMWGPDSRTYLIQDKQGRGVSLWDVRENVIRGVLPHQGDVVHARMSPDGSLVATTDQNGVVMVWDSRSFRLLHRFSERAPSRFGLSFTPDNRRLAVADANSQITLYDLLTGQEIGSLQIPHPVGVFGCSFSQDGQWLAAGGLPAGIYYFKAKVEQLNWPSSSW